MKTLNFGHDYSKTGKPRVKKSNRSLYGYAPWFFAFGLLIILAGFYKSFLMRFGSNDHKHQFHGVAALLWMILLIVQPVLTTRGTIKWHGILGKLSFVLVPFIIISILFMEQAMITSKASYPPDSV